MINIINAIKSAFTKLVDNDGILFDCQQEDYVEYDQRKLHEVCINHKLANHLEEFLFPEINPDLQPLFTDIEFNREGINSKELEYNGQDNVVRPDIIIHNRRTGDNKINFLIVECKKAPANRNDIETDIHKIKAFLTTPKYNYLFGLKVLYSRGGVDGTFYYKENGEVKTQEI